MSTLIHMVESERANFINSMRGFPDEISYHLDTSQDFNRAEQKDYIVTQFLNSSNIGNMVNTFTKILARVKK